MFIDVHSHHDAGNDIVQIVGLYSDFARASSGLLCSIGLHPCFLENHQQLLPELERLAVLPNVLAIGECGLDRVCNKDIAVQENIFRSQVALANRLNKPLVIHCVRAYEELLKVIHEMKSSVPVIIHGYNKKANVAQKLLANNMYLSFGPAILNGKSPAAQVLKNVPAQMFFLETDGSDVPISEVYHCAAEIRETSLDALTSQLAQNFRTVFKYQT